MQGRILTSGFGGLEESVTQRSTDNNKSYNVTTSVELGKFFPDKAKVSAPLYYSVSKEEVKPKYNPLDTDMSLDDALDACANEHQRDSLKSIAITKTTNTFLPHFFHGLSFLYCFFLVFLFVHSFFFFLIFLVFYNLLFLYGSLS